MKQKKLIVDVERFHEEVVGIERGGKRLVEFERPDLTPSVESALLRLTRFR